MASKSNNQHPNYAPHDRFFRSCFQRPDIVQSLRYITRIWSWHEGEKRPLHYRR